MRYGFAWHYLGIYPAVFVGWVIKWRFCFCQMLSFRRNIALFVADSYRVLSSSTMILSGKLPGRPSKYHKTSCKSWNVWRFEGHDVGYGQSQGYAPSCITSLWTATWQQSHQTKRPELVCKRALLWNVACWWWTVDIWVLAFLHPSEPRCRWLPVGFHFIDVLAQFSTSCLLMLVMISSSAIVSSVAVLVPFSSNPVNKEEMLLLIWLPTIRYYKQI